MKRITALLCSAILISASAFAQATPSEESPVQEKATAFTFTQKGDQNIRMSMSVTAPANFPDFGALFIRGQHQLSFGGLLNFGYNYFLTKNISVGGEAGFGFNVTIGSHIFNYTPLLAVATYQPSFGKFEIPLSLGVGLAWETYSNYNYFPGLVVRPRAGLHYRITPSWSLGGDVSYIFMPQFTELYNKGPNFYGQFADISLVAKYYF